MKVIELNCSVMFLFSINLYNERVIVRQTVSRPTNTDDGREDIEIGQHVGTIMAAAN